MGALCGQCAKSCHVMTKKVSSYCIWCWTFHFRLKDRDLVVKGKMSKDAQGMISIQNKAIEGGYPLNPDYVRIQDYEGDWTFQKLGNHKVKVSTYGYANPEGSIPLSFVNMFVQQNRIKCCKK